MADASLIEIIAEPRSKRGVIGWLRAHVLYQGPGRYLFMRLISSPWVVTISARENDQRLADFPADSAKAAKSIVSRLEGELAGASTLESFLRMHSVPDHLIRDVVR